MLLNQTVEVEMQGTKNRLGSSSPAKSSAGDGEVEGSSSVVPASNQTGSQALPGQKDAGSPSPSNNKQTVVASPNVKRNPEQTGRQAAPGRSSGAANNPKGNAAAAGSSENHSAAQGNSSRSGNNSKGSRSSVEQDGGSGWNGKKADWFSEVASCDMFHGDWVRDDSYPLYPEGSCPYLHRRAL
jgi:hypothetical protein|uniref:Trichome birefringence-like N-terminal domain-containing protein n=1 Tax=Zea mays TaxID=4577 RepID=A0A804PWN4_MAIZE